MAKYKLSENGVIDTERGMSIPNDPGNRHWQEYLDWVDLGYTADPQYTAQEIEDEAWADLRSERNYLLRSTDFMMTQDYYSSMTEQEQSDMTSYRQDLRDLPSNTIDPTDVTWPTKPQIVTDNGI